MDGNRKDELKRLISEYMCGKISPDEEKKAKSWLYSHIADPEHDNLFSALLEETEPSGDIESKERTIKQIERMISAEEINAKMHRRSRMRSFLVGIMSAAAVAAIVVFLIPEKQVQWHEVYAGRCETKEILLPDGTRLWAASDTKVIYPSKFASDTRTVFVDGEVYADVTMDKRKPFIISSSDVRVKVHGTEFKLKAFSDSPEVEVALVNGSVTVEGGQEGFSKTLEPGEMIRYNRADGIIEDYTFDNEDCSYGPDYGSMRFVNQTLSEISRDLERLFGVEIIISDNELARGRYYASFVNGESLEQVLAALNAGGHMDISYRDNVILISKM